MASSERFSTFVSCCGQPLLFFRQAKGCPPAEAQDRIPQQRNLPKRPTGQCGWVAPALNDHTPRPARASAEAMPAMPVETV